MGTLHFVFAWANAPYTVSGGVAVLFALLQASGLLGVLAGGSDHDIDADADVNADADVDADADHDVDHAADGDRSLGAVLFAPLGLGKIPFSIVWQSYAIVFAITGYLVGLVSLRTNGTVPALTLAWSLPIAASTGYAAVAGLARVLGPVLSSKAQAATTRRELVGQIGVVISSRVSPEFGEVRIKDKSGHDLRVVCRLSAGEREPTERETVAVVDCDDEGRLLVSPIDDAVDERHARSAG